jgi:hemoglobin
MQEPPRSGGNPNEDAPAPPPAASAFERLGGEPVLRRVIDEFVDRVVRDTMIGFFFRSVDITRLKQFEYEFAAAHLGGPTRYTGRPLGQAHGQHPILGGQFNRRLKILENTLRDLGVPDELAQEWLAHNARLRSVITRDAGDECILPPGATKPARPEENE